MAGGVGSRFWPFSTNEKPKQFLDFFGTGRSLLRMTYERLDGIVPASNVFIVTNKIYKETILEQLPELTENQVLLEPMRRNTAPCIAYAVYRIQKQNPKANIVVLPSDHLITNEKEFQRVITEGFRFVANNDALLTLGMKPTRPETGYGYIQVNSREAITKVKTFTEKPNLEMAQTFLASGEFLWNSGIFVWSVEQIRAALQRFLPELSALFAQAAEHIGTEREKEAIERVFSECRAISIDYGVMEKAENVYVHMGDFGWSDMGTWGSLYQYYPKDDEGNASSSECVMFDATGCLVSTPKDKLSVINGLKDYIVVDTPDVLMICPRSNEPIIKTFINEIRFRKGDKHI
jgi:mannose-1-phosphate guanylyltransferase